MNGAAGALAAAAARLVVDHDTMGTLTRLVIDCADVVGGAAGGLMMPDGDGPLEVLTSSSHESAELDLYELQAGEGPCLEAYATASVVHADSAEELRRRWPVFGTRMAELGFGAVYACPLTWRGSPIGALNVFSRAEGELDVEAGVVVRAFADIATVVVVQAGTESAVDLAAATRHALESRTVIERAKGVVAAQRGLDMSAAFELLLAQSQESGTSLEEHAQQVIQGAVRQPE